MRKAEIDEYIQKIINRLQLKKINNRIIEKLTEISFTWTPPDEYFYKGP